MSEKTKRGLKFPHTYALLFAMIIIAAILTYIIPAGQYQMIESETGRMVVDPNSYVTVESNPAKVFDIFKAIPKGLGESQSIVFFIFIVGGAFGIINKTGAIEAGINSAALSLKGAEKLMIPLFVILFSIGGATFGMSEETIVFIPIGIALARALGYDAIVGMAMVSLGAGAGFTSGFMNPFTVGVAQGIAGIPLFSGIQLRLAVWACTVALVSIYTYKYAMKVKKDPSKSYVYDLEKNHSKDTIDESSVEKMTGRHSLVLAVFAGGMLLIIFGVFKYGWYITEIAAVFLAMGIISGLVEGMNLDDLSNTFIEGAKDLTTGALVVGIARGILVVMQDASIIDTIVYALAQAISMLPRSVSAIGMLIVQSFLNFIIPSGSGLAATTMPIMAPLADVIGVTRQTAVLAYQFGDGITNLIVPTSGVLMASLTISKISYEQWAKFAAPLMVLWTLMGCAFMVVAVAINYGPF